MEGTTDYFSLFAVQSFIVTGLQRSTNCSFLITETLCLTQPIQSTEVVNDGQKESMKEKSQVAF